MTDKDLGALPASPSVPTEGHEAAVVGLREVELGRDAARYRRLRLLGCAVMDTPQLSRGTVLRFQSLDAVVDADMDAHPSRGEAEYSPPDPAEVRSLIDAIARALPAAPDTASPASQPGTERSGVNQEILEEKPE